MLNEAYPLKARRPLHTRGGSERRERCVGAKWERAGPVQGRNHDRDLHRVINVGYGVDSVANPAATHACYARAGQ